VVEAVGLVTALLGDVSVSAALLPPGTPLVVMITTAGIALYVAVLVLVLLVVTVTVLDDMAPL
jgi:hypothetical protein